MADRILIDRAVVEQALEALGDAMQMLLPKSQSDKARRAAYALRDALAQQAKPAADPFNCPKCGRHDYGLHGACPTCDAQQAEPTRSQKLADAGFSRRPSLWALQARKALELIAAPQRSDGTWNRDREACRQLAAEALGHQRR